MEKDDAKKQFLAKIYDYNGKIVISKQDIKRVEAFYKANYRQCVDFDSFLQKDDEICTIINQMNSGKDAIKRKISVKEALQPGILAECVFMQTLAKILGLRSYLDLENESGKLPKEIAPYLQSNARTWNAGRYVYFNRANPLGNPIIIQYGNPEKTDASVIIDGQEIHIELKDMPALLRDKDLLYDENGKLLISDEIKKEYPIYEKYINIFNRNTSVMQEMGSNYPLFVSDSPKDRQAALQEYFDTGRADILMTSVKDELVAIDTKDINFIFPDGEPLISTTGSEIRTTGKNARKKPFTPEYLVRVLKDTEVVVENLVCRVDKDNDKVIGMVKGRGRNEYTRFKINNAFFVKTEDITSDDDANTFRKDRIQQSKAGIALHLHITKSKQEIREALGY